MGTISCGGLIHIWRSGEDLGEQDSVCGGWSQNKLQCVCSFNCFGQHCSCMAHRNKIYQALIETQSLLVG